MGGAVWVWWWSSWLKVLVRFWFGSAADEERTQTDQKPLGSVTLLASVSLKPSCSYKIQTAWSSPSSSSASAQDRLCSSTAPCWSLAVTSTFVKNHSSDFFFLQNKWWFNEQWDGSGPIRRRSCADEPIGSQHLKKRLKYRISSK